MGGAEFVMGITTVLVLFVGLPWLVFHYITKWKQSAKITPEDENLLDDMYNLARRLEERVVTVERIIAADHPEFRAGLTAPSGAWRDQPRANPDQIDRRNRDVR